MNWQIITFVLLIIILILSLLVLKIKCYIKFFFQIMMRSFTGNEKYKL